MTVQDLPTLNACLNGGSALLLLSGYFLIKSGRVTWHRASMVSAFILSSIFLGSYLTYHYKVGTVYFRGHGAIRAVYLTILLTHTILAVLVVPLCLRTLYLALKERFEEHRLAAKWTFPVWMYVSVTGVVVYWMLYRLQL